MELTVWLKESIPGIILLGAIGSLLAVLAIWLAKKLFQSVASQAKARFNKLLLRLFGAAAREHVNLYMNKDQYSLQAYFTFQLMKLIFSLFSLGISLLILFRETDFLRAPFLSPAVFFSIVASFLSLWWLFQAFVRIFLPRLSNIPDAVSKSVKELQNGKRKAS